VRKRWAKPVLLVVLVVASSTTFVAVTRARTRERETSRALQLARDWHIQGIPPDATGKSDYSAIMGDECWSLLLRAPAKNGGLGAVLSSLNCRPYDDLPGDCTSMYAFFETFRLGMPPLDEITAAGRCDFDQETQVQYMRFKSEDVVLFRRIRL
jgi:hypothetical protein